MRLVDHEALQHAVGVQAVHGILQRDARGQPLGRDEEHLGARVPVVERAKDLRAAPGRSECGGGGAWGEGGARCCGGGGGLRCCPTTCEVSAPV